MIADHELDLLLRDVLADEAATAERDAPSLDHAVSTLRPRVQSRAGGTVRLLLVLAAVLLLVGVLASAIAVGGWLRNDDRLSLEYVGEFQAVGQLPQEAGPQAIVAQADGSALLVGRDQLFRFDPSTSRFTPVGTLQIPRDSPAAVALRDGRVLIVGGGHDIESPSTPGSYRAEIYDPASGLSTLVGSTVHPRLAGTATLLEDGRVLVGSGSDAELFDPATGEFVQTGSMPTPLTDQAATLLADGRVLVISTDSEGAPTAELYDPLTGSFVSAGPMAVPQADGSTATRLADGRVLIVGGWDDHGSPLAAAQLYNPTTGRFTLTGSLPGPRAQHAAALLDDGRVLIVGGWDGSGTKSAIADADDAFIYDPATGTFTPTASLTVQRIFPFAVTLADGRVLVVGNRCYAGAGNCGLDDIGQGAGRDSSAEVFE